MLRQALKHRIKRTIYRLVLLPSVSASYSQAGEDAVLRFLFKDKRMERISYLDIGTGAPDYGNNTYLFYCRGSRGVCLEADRTLVARIRAVRPEDKVLNVGVATDSRAEADLYVFNCSAISTFDKEEADKRVASGKYRIVDVANTC